QIAFCPRGRDFLCDRRHLHPLHLLDFRFQLVKAFAGHRHNFIHGPFPLSKQCLSPDKKRDPLLAGRARLIRLLSNELIATINSEASIPACKAAVLVRDRRYCFAADSSPGDLADGRSFASCSARICAVRATTIARSRCAAVKYGSVMPFTCLMPTLLAISSQLKPF